jgi:hypothetical protein
MQLKSIQREEVGELAASTNTVLQMLSGPEVFTECGVIVADCAYGA